MTLKGNIGNLEKQLDSVKEDVKKIVSEIKHLTSTSIKNSVRVEQLSIDLEKLEIKLENLQKALTLNIDSVREDGDKKFVTKDKFEPVKIIAFGTVSAIILAVFSALIKLVIKH